ncbi:MAG: NADH-quinone oxidoreductase subunit NuoH [Candidatus Dormibacteria bacterium]
MNNPLITLILGAFLVFVLLTAFAYLTFTERRVMARMQIRLGPNRVGPMGLLQPLADGIKLAFKESVVPEGASTFLYYLAPAIAVVAAVGAFAVIPWGGPLTVLGQHIYPQIADLNIGVLYIFAVATMSIYSIVLGGWASNSKYPLLGGMRSAAQMVSYEMAQGLSIIGVLMLAGSLRLSDIVQVQHTHLPFIFLQPVGFVLFAISIVAETNRAPFDLAEAEQELVAGFHTEYSGMKFALFFMAEYINMITVSALLVVLFLDGWHGPGPVELGALWFLAKVAACLFVFIWLRSTLPRLRYDRLMKLGWKVLLPVALANTLVTAVAVTVCQQTGACGRFMP